MLVLKGLVGLFRTIQLQLLQRTGWGINLDYCGIEWFALETNRDHSVVFEIASMLPFHGSICGCPAEGAFPWGPCAVQVWCFGTE